MINIIAGLPGAGKTAYLAKLVQKFLVEGEVVYSYKYLHFNDDRVRYFDEITEIKKLKNVIIILDEAQIWFNSRYWDKIDPALQYALQQHRHAGVDIWGAVQHINRLDTMMRELVQNYYEIRRVIGTSIRRKNGQTIFPRHPFQISLLQSCDIHRVKNVTRNVGSGLVRPVLFTRKEFDFYDTLAEYEDVFLNARFQVDKVECWTCRTCGHKSIKSIKK